LRGGQIISFQGDGGKIEQSERLLGIFRECALQKHLRLFEMTVR
jgi:hypothetical protein